MVRKKLRCLLLFPYGVKVDYGRHENIKKKNLVNIFQPCLPPKISENFKIAIFFSNKLKKYFNNIFYGERQLP